MMTSTRSPPRKNCCTWKVAAFFLVLVAVALILTWQLLPAEDIVAKYIPQFDEPENIYSGPEAGAPGGGGSAGGGDGDGGESEKDGDAAGGEAGGNDGGVTIDVDIPNGETSDESEVGTAVPSFMKCPEGDELCCNGSPLNCNLRVDQMMFGLVHNSMSAEETDFTFGYNHKLGLEKALVAGYRGLSLDVCNCNGVLQFCHNICDFGERVPNEVFTNIAQFLDEYPSEVVVLLFEASKETGTIVWNDLYTEMGAVDGFVDMIYEPTYGAEWPLMGDLVEQNKRIIVFYFNGGTCNNDTCPDGFKYFYNYAAETEYQSASLEDLENSEYSCEITRGPKEDAPFPAQFFVVNNFVTPPDEDASAMANSKKFLADRLTNCANMNNMRPNFIYLDFWSQGVTAQLVQYANVQFAEQLGR